MNTCLNCNDEVTDKQKYCSDRCRKAYTRRTKAGQLPGQTDPVFNPDKAKVSDLRLTRTDRLFEDSKPNYYQYPLEDARNDVCLECGKRFTTRMKLLRNCSPLCIRTMLDSLTV